MNWLTRSIKCLMTKEDFHILRNSITMIQLVNFYGMQIYKKGSVNFIRCPFHGGGSERTPSMIIYEGYRGFYCRGCGQGGDVTRFTELYENLTSKEAGILLAERFGIQISETGTVDEEVRRKAQKAEHDRQQQLLLSQQIKADLKRLGSYIYAYKSIIDREEPFSEMYCYCQNELPKVTWEWEEKFSQLRKD